MESLKELYRIGYGPSSSHTMGPRNAACMFLEKHPEAKKVRAELYGSLAATGKGHLTDRALRDVFKEHGSDVEILWFPDTFKKFHPNALTLVELEPESASETYYSVGGGKVVKEGESSEADQVYDDSKVGTMRRLISYCDEMGYQIWEVAVEAEGEEILDYIFDVWTVMKEAIKRGLEAEGVLPGGLHLQRKACQAYAKARDFSGTMGSTAHGFAYALAVSEENAGGGRIVTAPTCGSAGVLPGALYHISQEYKIPEVRILRALLTAGMVGNIVKENGSISGAEVGCQGEVGVACAMAGAACAQLLGGSVRQIEYAAEMGLEHHLGLTCDPLMGLVQIPCIERSFDDVVEVMMETGHALPSLYRETSMGGLARIHEM